MTDPIDNADELRQLGLWVRRMGLENYVRNQMKKQSNRVFFYGGSPPYSRENGTYGWIMREDHSKTNPYFIIQDGIVNGLWYKDDEFIRVLESE